MHQILIRQIKKVQTFLTKICTLDNSYVFLIKRVFFPITRAHKPEAAGQFAHSKASHNRQSPS